MASAKKLDKFLSERHNEVLKYGFYEYLCISSEAHFYV